MLSSPIHFTHFVLYNQDSLVILISNKNSSQFSSKGRVKKKLANYPLFMNKGGPQKWKSNGGMGIEWNWMEWGMGGIFLSTREDLLSLRVNTKIP